MKNIVSTSTSYDDGSSVVFDAHGFVTAYTPAPTPVTPDPVEPTDVAPIN